MRTLPHGNHPDLVWVLGSLISLIAILQFGGGFIAGSTSTAQARHEHLESACP